jgi:hypothetical protein
MMISLLLLGLHRGLNASEFITFLKKNYCPFSMHWLRDLPLLTELKRARPRVSPVEISVVEKLAWVTGSSRSTSVFLGQYRSITTTIFSYQKAKTWSTFQKQLFLGIRLAVDRKLHFLFVFKSLNTVTGL